MTAPLGLQLYSLREAANVNFEETVRKVAEIGYSGVEPAGFPGTTPLAAARLFDELGLKVCSIHAQAPQAENKNEILEMLEALRCPRLVVPWQPMEQFTSRDGIQKICDVLNEASELGKANGFTVGYHNHWWEAEYRLDGKPAYQIMLDYLNPEVFFQVDTYWIQVGGLDVVEVVKGLGKRAPMLHIKDGPGVKDKAMTAAGDGVMDWHAIIKAAGTNPEWLIVELDSCDTDMFEAVTKSYQYMTREGLAHGKV